MSDSVWLHRRQPTGSPVPGILQARALEWVAISFSKAWKWKVKMKSLSHFRPSVTPWTAAYQAPPSMGFSRQEYWSGVPLPSGCPSCQLSRVPGAARTLRPKLLHHLRTWPSHGKPKSSRAASGASPSGWPTCRGRNKTTIETQGQCGLEDPSLPTSCTSCMLNPQDQIGRLFSMEYINGDWERPLKKMH